MNNLKDFRKSLNLTQAELSKKQGLIEPRYRDVRTRQSFRH